MKCLVQPENMSHGGGLKEGNIAEARYSLENDRNISKCNRRVNQKLQVDHLLPRFMVPTGLAVPVHRGLSEPQKI